MTELSAGDEVTLYGQAGVFVGDDPRDDDCIVVVGPGGYLDSWNRVGVELVPDTVTVVLPRATVDYAAEYWDAGAGHYVDIGVACRAALAAETGE